MNSSATIKAGDQHKRKRLPRMLLTREESDAVFGDMQASFAEAQVHFEDMSFIKDTDDQVRWMRMEAAIEESDKRECGATFALPNLGLRRPMRFTCPGHGDGPCRVSAAANCLLEFPSLLARVLPQTGGGPRNDLLRFRLWSFGRWEDVYLDDMLPFELDGSQVILTTNHAEKIHEVPMPLLQYMKLQDPQSAPLEVWPFFLEKAVAKMLGSYHLLKSLTFDAAIAMMMGCEVLSKRISDSHARQVTSLLRLLTVLQRNSIVFLRQEAPAKLSGCSEKCMLHKTDDIYVVLAFKEMSDVLNIGSDKKSENLEDESGAASSVGSLQFLRSVQILVRRVSCRRLASHMRCQATPTEKDEGKPGTQDPSSRIGAKPLIDMSQEQLFTEKGVFWETAAYLMAHFSHVDMCFFTQDTPPTADEDLISLTQLPWHASHASGAWVRGKNSVITGNRRQLASYCPHYVLDLRAASPNRPVLVALTLRQVPISWRRANQIPARLQLYFIGEQLLCDISRRDAYELKNREQLERRLDTHLQLAHRSVFTTGSVAELLTLRQGSFLILLEVGVPGDEGEYILSAFSSCRCDLMPMQNVIDVSFECGTCNPEASIRCRELGSCPVRTEKEQLL